MAIKLFHQRIVAIKKPIINDSMKLINISFEVTKIWFNKLLVLIKLVIVLKILLGEEKRKVLIICNLLKISQIKKKIINDIANKDTDRYKAYCSIFGAFIGDALGSYVEFSERSENNSKKISWLF